MRNKFDHKPPKIGKEGQIPIRRGCPNKQCFCTGKCEEIIAWRDPLPHEKR